MISFQLNKLCKSANLISSTGDVYYEPSGGIDAYCIRTPDKTWVIVPRTMTGLNSIISKNVDIFNIMVTFDPYSNNRIAGWPVVHAFEKFQTAMDTKHKCKFQPKELYYKLDMFGIF